MSVSLFLSYSVADRAYVVQLAQRLEGEAGLTAWWFEAKQKAGRDYSKEIMRQIARAHAVVVLVSQHSADSESVKKELVHARRVGKLIIPVLIGPPTSGSPFNGMAEDGRVLYDLRHLDCINGRGENDPLPRLLAALTPDESILPELSIPIDAPDDRLAGTSLKGYLLERRVSITEQNVVYRALEPAVGRQVAIKIIHPTLANHPGYIRRFAEEARRVVRLDHPHIVKLLAFWRNDTGAFLVMPWLPGGTLISLLHGGPLPLTQVARLFAQISSALSYAHRYGVIHRDLKPGNILRDANGNAYLSDFGIAQDVSAQQASGHTYGYAPPEQVLNAPATTQTDIYSLGVILWEVLAGSRAFSGTPTEIAQQQHAPPTLRTARPDLPEVLEHAIQRALAHDPEDRYPDMASFVAAVNAGFAHALATRNEPTLAEAAAPVLSDLPATANPYKGLAAFAEDDSSVFYGRSDLTHTIISQLSQPGSNARLVAVVGPSGSGKSSVVRAGFVPALRRGGLPNGQHWYIGTMLPGSDPLRSLVSALEPLASRHLRDPLARLYASPQGLSDLVQELLPPEPAVELLLVIDQFEEVFTLAQDSVVQQHLLESLIAAVRTPDSRLRVILTLRADFYDRPLSVPGFGDLLRERTIWVLPMREAELEQAIVAPARQMGVGVENDLVREIIADLEEQPGALPLLQYALRDLFERRAAERLTLADYRALGGIQGALARRADEVYTALTPVQQRLAEQLFLRLVTPGEGSADTRRRVRRSELSDLVAPASSIAATATTVPALPPTIPVSGLAPIASNDAETQAMEEYRKSAISDQRLEIAGSSTFQSPISNLQSPAATVPDLNQILEGYGNTRLLTFDADQEATVEVAHEALFQAEGGWERLRDWLATARDDLRTQRRLAELTNEWQRQNYDASYLSTGGSLAQFEELARRGTIDLNRSEHSYLAASIATREQAERNERNRLERELASERERTAERETANRGLRRRTVFLTVFLIIAIIASSAAGLFGVQARQNAVEAEQQRAAAVEQQETAEARREEAETQRQKAEAQRLAAAVIELIAEDEIERGLLLAIEAAQIGNNSTSWQALPAAVAARTASSTTIQTPSEEIYHLAMSSDSKRILIVGADTRAYLRDTQGSLLAILEGHTDGINVAAFSPDGKHLLTASDDTTARLWDSSGRPLAILNGHTDRVGAAVFSPDGLNMLTTSNDNTARLWDIQGQLIATLEGHTKRVWNAVFSPDGKHILTASGDGTARLWDLQGQQLGILSGHSDDVITAVFHPTDTTILTASWDGTARIWKRSGQFITTLADHEDKVIAATFSNDGKHIVTASLDNTARLWSHTGEMMTTLSGHTDDVISADFSVNNNYILTASHDGTARLWDHSGNFVMILEGHIEKEGLQAIFSPDSKRVLTGSIDGSVRLWGIDQSLLPTLQGHTDKVTSAIFSTDGNHILTSSYDHTARIWNNAGDLVVTLIGHTGIVRRAIFSPNGNDILTSSADRAVRLWDRKGQLLLTLKSSVSGASNFSPDGNHILMPVRKGAVQIWDRDGRLVHTLEGHTETVTSVVFSPDGQQVLTTSLDNTARLWAKDGTLQAVLYGHSGVVNNSVFSPQGDLIATISDDMTGRLWDRQGLLLAVLEGHTGSVESISFSPDGNQMLTGSWDGTARLWDREGRPTGILQGHTDRVVNSMYSPNGSLILTGSWDGTVRLWSKSGQPITVVQSHPDEIYSAVFSPDGNRILTASADGTARLWPVHLEDWLAAAACRVGRSLTEEEIRTYNVPTPLKFRYEDRQCPPRYGWERTVK
jgi:WD40 repeat protein/serine/threonine protein kinase